MGNLCCPLVLTLHTTQRYYDRKPRVATLDSIFLALLMIKDNGLNDTMLSPFEVWKWPLLWG